MGTQVTFSCSVPLGLTRQSVLLAASRHALSSKGYTRLFSLLNLRGRSAEDVSFINTMEAQVVIL